jgi:hypothetical protein
METAPPESNLPEHKRRPYPIVAAIGLTGVALLAVWVSYSMARERVFRKASDQFDERIAKCYHSFKPGEAGQFEVTIAPGEADQVLYLPKYLEQTDCRAFNLDAGTAELLYGISQSHTAPALIWLKDGQIESVQHLKLQVGLSSEGMQKWRVAENGLVRIHVRKEMQSPNSFLSLEFVEPH